MTRTSLGARLIPLVPLAVLFLVPLDGCSRWPFISTTTVTVGDGPCQLTPSQDVSLSLSAGDQIKWKPSRQGTPLTIVFKRTGFPAGTQKAPFANMPQNANGDYYIPSSLLSGPINSQLTNIPPEGFLYKYDQILAGMTCDGHIIIQR